MREYIEPALVASPTTGNLTDHIEHNAASFPLIPSISIPHNNEWRSLTCLDVRNQIRAVAKGLIADGIQPGDRVAIFSRTRMEWTIADYAIWYAGAVTVPIYETSSSSQVEWMMSDSGVVATFFEAERTTSAFNEVADSLPTMQKKYIFANDALGELARRGSEISDEELDQRRLHAHPGDLATIIYTSGTTGRPKGCMLSHANFMNEVDNLVAGYPEIFQVAGSSTLMFLPLAHVFGRVIQVAMIRSRVLLAHCPNPASLLKDMEVFQPTFLLSVPRVFEKVYNGASSKAHDASSIKGKIFDQAAAVAIAFSEGLDSGRISPALRIQHSLYDKLVYSKLRAAMGGRVSYAISGGAALGSRLGHFFRGLGLIVLEGYGLTETTAGAVVNRPQQVRLGSVGLAVYGTSVKIADDGEVLLKGHHIFMGYWNNSQATLDVLDSDGWFHSGDLGSLDDDGFLYITGRKKELIVTAGGKNVAPAVLEDRLRAHPIISQCVVVGDAKPFIGALVTLDQDALPGILKAHGIAEAPLTELASNPQIRAIVQEAVNTANEAVSNSEAIKKFSILATDWTVDNGYLTPKMSIKRHLVTKDFASDIEHLYS